jgi:hypothetical protein
MAITFRRFALLQALLVWQGGFLFYAAFVVPEGTDLFGATGQGAVTARVTDTLNLLGAVGVAVFAIELSYTRDPSPRRTAWRWWAWGVALLCQAVLFYVHLLLDYLMDDARRRVVVVGPFYAVHTVYLHTSTVQWLACLLLMWLTLRAWRAEDADPRIQSPSQNPS